MATLLSGCQNEYPEDLRYPDRTDPMVVAPISVQPTHFDRPGELDRIIPDMLAKSESQRNNVVFPNALDGKKRASLSTYLGRKFGTPANPRANIGDDAIEALQLQPDVLAEGSKLYRLHCLHCHGLPGDGRGPTAPWVNPHPRDYRQGLFKFVSVDMAANPNANKPRRYDLARTLKEGIEGTTMPSFGLLPDKQIDAMVSYVIHLSIRGETEFNVLRKINAGDAEDVAEAADESLELISGSWVDSQASLVTPLLDGDLYLKPGDRHAQSAKAGFDLFRDDKASGCIGCHIDYGRQGKYFYDSWGTIGRPADLTLGVYRGGRRPIDLYWRIISGLNGSNMPSSAKSLKPNPGDIENLADEKMAGLRADPSKKEEVARLEKLLANVERIPDVDMTAVKRGLDAAAADQLADKLLSQSAWDLVNFLRAFPYPGMRKEFHLDLDS